ncbi:MAG TPA: hypothetical protein VN748_21345 [Pseudonocardiaceae bacterium]|jgi:hypothetical protein|nr:hypothetical protein [Pseudonocardiaceae bacterium]
MDAQQEHDEPQRREGFGGRVRRFIDTELSRAVDKDEPTHDAAATPAAHAAPATATAEETAPPPAEARRTDQVAADGSAQRVGLLNDPAGLRDQWQQVQATFVDDPQQAVHEASALVDRTLREIHENVSRGQISDPTSTEDLRVSFQRYREFFQRLLSA